MGSLIGHILPGTFFILFSVWWLVCILRKYYRSRYYRQDEGYMSSAMQMSSCLPRIPMEGILKVVACSIGIVGEAVTGFDKNWAWKHKGNAQHISMFLFFGITGVMDIIYFYKIIDMPPDLDYASAFIAFTMEGLLFANHLHGRTHMDVMIHTYLLYAIIGCAVCVALEAKYRDSVVLAIGRCYFTLLQGTWFYHIGFILYPPAGIGHYDEEDHVQMMEVTTIFSWHFAGAIAFVFFMIILVGRLTKRAALKDPRNAIQYQKIGMNTMKSGTANGDLGATRPIVANGSSLRNAFNDTSEDEV